MFTKKFCKISNGETIAYCDEGLGDKVILVIHGNYTSSYVMAPFVYHLPNGYRAIMPDLRGFGDSTYNHPFLTLKELSDDLRLFCQEMKIEKCIVVGHSLGGGVAMQFAIDSADITEKLVLVAPTSVYGYPIFKKDEAGKFLPFKDKDDLLTDPNLKVGNDMLVQKNIPLFDIVMGNLYKKKPSRRFLDESNEESMKEKDLMAADWALAVFNITDKPSLYGPGTNQVKDIKCPIFLATATEDAMVFPFMNAQNVASLSVGNLTHKEYQDCGHMIPCDQEEAFFKDYFEFLAK